jgi:hypothetical protein
MTASCTAYLGSGTRIYAIKNEGCLPVPIEHQIVLNAPIAVNDQTISVKLNSAFTPSSGAYTAASSYALYPGTFLYFNVGGVYTQVEVLEDVGAYNIGLIASTLRIQRATAAVAVTGVANTYFAGKICVQKANTTVNTSTQDNTVTCTGNQSTMVNTAFGEVLDLSGFPNAADRAYYDFIEIIGKKLGSVFILKDRDRFAHDTYIAQLTKPSETGAEAKGLVAYTLQAQIQNSISSFAGKIALTAAEIALAQAERRLYGADLGRY